MNVDKSYERITVKLIIKQYYETETRLTEEFQLSRLRRSAIKNDQYLFFGYVLSIQIIMRKTREITRCGSSAAK